MERINANEVQSIMEAYASIYEKKGEDCVPKSEKGTHNCAKKVCHEEFGQGETIFGQHAEPDENGFVSHYDVQFEHGIVENVSVEDMEVLTLVEHGGHKKKTMYAHTEVEGELVDEGIADDPRSGVLGQVERLRRKMFGTAGERNQAVSYERSVDALTKSRGGGNVPLGKDGKRITADQIAAETKRRRLADPKYKPGQGVDSGAKPGSGGGSGGGSGSGMTAAQIKAAQDKANQARRDGKMSDLRGGGGNTGKSPISNLSNALDKPSVVSPKTGETTKFERRLPTMAELRAAQAARKAAAAGGASKKEAEYQAVKAGVSAGKPAPKPATGGSGGYQVSAAATPKTRPANPAAAAAAAKAAEVKKPMPRPGARNRMRMEEVDVFDTIKEHLISEHELSEDVAIQVMTLLDEETRGEIMEYTAAIRADAAPKGTTMKITATGKEPAGDRFLRGIKDRVGDFLKKLNPKALKSTTVEPRKPLVSTQKNSYELEGELVDEGSCGSKKKKKSKKGGY